MTREQQMQLRKLHEWVDINPVMKQISAKARIAALEAELMVIFSTKRG